MNQPYALLAILCFLACSSILPQEDNDLKIWELKGPVKFVEQKYFFAKKRAIQFDLNNLRLEDDFRYFSRVHLLFTEKGWISEKKYFKTDDHLSGQHLALYDKKGNIQKSMNYTYYKNYRGKQLDNFKVYIYNEHSNLIEVAIFGIDSIPIRKTTYVYNEKQQKIEECDLNLYGVRKEEKFYFKYNSEGQLIERKRTPAKHAPKKKVYTYDNYGNRVSMTAYNSVDTINEKEQLSYRHNQLVEKIIEDHKKGTKRIMQYNEEGWLSEVWLRDLADENTVKEYYKHEYKYDRKGNWTQRASFVDSVLTQVQFRKIEYH